MKLNDVRVGECFRFLPDQGYDQKPTYADTHLKKKPADLPPTWDACDVDDKDIEIAWWKNGGGLQVELLEHYSRSVEPKVLTRGCIRVGECFQYLDGALDPGCHVMTASGTKPQEAPSDWIAVSVDYVGRNNQRVRRIPRWDGAKTETSVALVVEQTELQRLLDMLVDGRTGRQCFAAFEVAMQTESLCRSGNGFVSTNADGPGLNIGQCSLAIKIWDLKLAELRAAAKARDAFTSVSILIDGDHDDA
jgi:hypothetical protein